MRYLEEAFKYSKYSLTNILRICPKLEDYFLENDINNKLHFN